MVRAGVGRYYDKVMLNLTSNERRQILGQLISVTILNPDFNDPLGGRTYEDFKATAAPGDLTLLDTGYETPVNDQVSVGLAQQIGTRYALQIDYIHTKGYNEPMTPRSTTSRIRRRICRGSRRIFGRPYPAYKQHHADDLDGRSAYDGLQVGFNGRSARLTFSASYTLSKTFDNHGEQPRRHADQLFQHRRRLHLSRRPISVIGSSGMSCLLLPWDVQVAAIYFAGSPRPINVGTNRDPFRLGYNGRWLELPANCPCTGAVIPRNSERTTSDYKLDLRASKTFRVKNMSFQGVVDASTC